MSKSRAKFFLALWWVLSVLLSYEFIRLNHGADGSLLHALQLRNFLPGSFDLSPDPGHSLSLIFGYVGFGLMLLTNLYILRKRFFFLAKLGFLKNWLDFHIFCGLMGPTLILFHCNFKVRGLVAISFWSMIVSVSSGVVGRYLYVQISKMKSDFLREADILNAKIKDVIGRLKVEISEAELVHYRTLALSVAGADRPAGSPFTALYHSIVGDVRLRIGSVPAPAQLGDTGKVLLRDYAVNMRKANTVESFNRLMGYWHTFHTPFAVFMYISAFLHIVAEFWLGAA